MTPELGTVRATAAFDRLAARKKVKHMRILTLSLCVVGLALVTAACGGRTTTTSSAPAAAPAPSGAAATTTTMSGTSMGDRIDQWAAAVERERGMRR
jgi:uncharacterized lipoprotein YajG